MLEVAAAAGEIDLFFQDESGCCQWSEAQIQPIFSWRTETTGADKDERKALKHHGTMATVSPVCL